MSETMLLTAELAIEKIKKKKFKSLLAVGIELRLSRAYLHMCLKKAGLVKQAAELCEANRYPDKEHWKDWSFMHHASIKQTAAHFKVPYHRVYHAFKLLKYKAPRIHEKGI